MTRDRNWPSPQRVSEPLHDIRYTEEHIACFPTPPIIWLDSGNWTKGISGLLTFVRSSVRSWHTYVLQADITAHVSRTPDNWNRRKRSIVALTLASTAITVITGDQSNVNYNSSSPTYKRTYFKKKQVRSISCCDTFKLIIMRTRAFHINPLALELDIYSLAHLLCKMWIFYEPRRITSGNTRHFVDE